MTTLSIIYKCELCSKEFYRKRDADWHVCNEHNIISEEVMEYDVIFTECDNEEAITC